MRRESKTKDPVGTVMGGITGGAAVLAGLALAGPVGAVIGGIVQFFIAKKISKKFVADEIDEISLNNCDRMAETWRNQVGRGSATIGVTTWSDTIIPLPQTRIHHYTFGDEEDDSIKRFLRPMPKSLLSDDDDD